MNPCRYTPETIATLRDMRAAGASYGTIRDALGIKSRSAVAGLVTRYCADLPKQISPVPPRPAVADPKQVAPPPAPRFRPHIVRTRPAVPEEIRSNPVHFFDAKGCRYPLWSSSATFPEKMVCGAACREGQTFCEGHRALAYRPKERRVA